MRAAVRSGWCDVRAGLALAAWLGLGLAAGAARAEPPAPAPCPLRTVEKNGVRFVEIGCATDLYLSETPLACPPESEAGAACDPITALAPAPREGRANRHVDVLVVDGERARRLCRERFGGRLPTPGERERARGLGFVSVQVREEPGEFARLRLDELPEWVADGDRPARAPAAVPRPRVADEALLGCVAEPALPRARGVPLGSVCDERPLEAEVRSPDCALAAPDGARFEIGCDPAHVVRSKSHPDHAAVRCVVRSRDGR
jgi:hypothetical protein